MFFWPGIFFLSVASLGFEVVLTRLFAVSIGYAFAVLAISLALLGYGAAGAFLHARPGLTQKALEKWVLTGSGLFSLALPAAYGLVNRLPLEPNQLIWDRRQPFILLLALLILFVPFFCAGLTLAACFTLCSRDIGRCYGFDLGGSALGCLLPVLLFAAGWDERILLLLAAGGCLAWLCFALSLDNRRMLVLPLAAAAFILIGSLVRASCGGFRRTAICRCPSDDQACVLGSTGTRKPASNRCQPCGPGSHPPQLDYARRCPISWALPLTAPP